MRYLIFKNVKRWLIEYGIDLLDIILKPVDTSTRDTTKRYDNFMHELNRHFSSQAFYQSNFYAHLPLLTLQVHNIGYVSSCYCEYMLDFQYHWTTISAGQEKDLENTPEALYEMEDCISYLLSDMMSSKKYVDNTVVKRTVFTDLWDLPNFDGKLYNVSSIQEYPMQFIKVDKEINTISKQFKITIGEC